MKLLIAFALLAMLGISMAGTFCLDVWKPVCGINGRTYSNSCFAEQAHVKIAHTGICKPLCTYSKTMKCILIMPAKVK